MKISRLFTIDVETAEKLSNVDNASSLVNQLLQEYFKFSHKKYNIFDQKKDILSNFKAKTKQIKQEMKLISKVSELGFDQFAINWCIMKQFCYDDLEIQTYLRGRRLKVTLDQFKKGAEIIENNGHLFKKIESS